MSCSASLPCRRARTSRCARLAFLLAALALCTGLAACQRADVPANPEAAAGAAADQRSSDIDRAAARDMQITILMNKRLAADEELSAMKIDVETHDGEVLLRGPAPDPVARERAGELARGIAGVRAVDNRLSVPGGAAR
ncbi:BON domain-containing protein [Ramlibacter sp. AN1015]|uniref:BON domain-containing protein n=1 Tax=Ramlibacter sp. AN1015 TaxID=3133428 RepID=UPI0030C1B603